MTKKKYIMLTILTLAVLSTKFGYGAGDFVVTPEYTEDDVKRAEKSDAVMRSVLSEQMKTYDPKLRPNYTGAPTYVYVDFSIVSIGRIREVDMILPVDMFFRQIWHDYRLRHSLNKSLILMMGQKHPSEMIWVPDTTFINAVHATRHHVTVNNDKLDVHPNGKIFWGMRATVQASCKLDLRAYPMDSQTCEIGIESYAYTDDHVIYRWRVSPGVKMLNSDMDQYVLLKHDTTEETMTYVADTLIIELQSSAYFSKTESVLLSKQDEQLSSEDKGSYSLLYCKFTFERKIAYALIQVYVPVIAIVFVSWVSLWIHRDSTAARVALCVTTLLTICTIWGNINGQLPRVNYIKAIDIYLMVSFCFVFCTLVEYTLVLNIDSRIRRRWSAEKRKQSSKNMSRMMDLDEREDRRQYSDDESDIPSMHRLLPGIVSNRKRSPVRTFKQDCEAVFEPQFRLTRYRSSTFTNGNGFGVETRKLNGNMNSYDMDNNNTQNGHAGTNGDAKADKGKAKKVRETSIIDLIARALFPMSFAIFNILYWTRFLKNKTIF